MGSSSFPWKMGDLALPGLHVVGLIGRSRVHRLAFVADPSPVHAPELAALHHLVGYN